MIFLGDERLNGSSHSPGGFFPWLYARRYFLLVALLATVVEIYIHIQHFHIPRPDHPLDPPFARQCALAGSSSSHGSVIYPDQTPPDALEARENAVILMLARNGDAEEAAAAVRSFEDKWNKHFNYPYVFLNDEPFTAAFESALRSQTLSNVTFASIPSEMWAWPTDEHHQASPSHEQYKQAMQSLYDKDPGIPYLFKESYHQMCRFYSGFFANHPALHSYSYFWRIEPDSRYTCRIPYDPFRQMHLGGKKYGYTIALGEIGGTVPSLMRAVDDYRRTHNLPRTRNTWRAMFDPSTAPLPLRYLLMPFIYDHRTAEGDVWNLCHFWSNFEIASLDFFRSPAYQGLFKHLDASGGFFTERWGDAPVHTLAAGLLLEDSELHHFADIGYSHTPWQQCPMGKEDAGCDCDCDKGREFPDRMCLNRVRAGYLPAS